MFDIYFGGENILSYTQEDPILGAGDWSSNFDASLIYAPVHGRMFYLGIRYSLDSKVDWCRGLFSEFG